MTSWSSSGTRCVRTRSTGSSSTCSRLTTPPCAWFGATRPSLPSRPGTSRCMGSSSAGCARWLRRKPSTPRERARCPGPGHRVSDRGANLCDRRPDPAGRRSGRPGCQACRLPRGTVIPAAGTWLGSSTPDMPCRQAISPAARRWATSWTPGCTSASPQS
jgi:hypothetical protein